MTFKDRIDRLLEIKELDRLSINKIEKALGVDGTIYKGIKDPKYIPSSELVSEIIRIYNLRKSWWDNPVSNNPEDIYVENGTPMPKEIQNNGKHENTADELIRHLVQGDSDYVLINKELILERYRLYSIEQIEGIKEEAALKHKEILQELEDRKNQIHGLYKIISELTSKLPPGEPAHVQKTK